MNERPQTYLLRKEREDAWQDLDALLRRTAADGLRSLSSDEIHRLPILYQTAVRSLAVARAISFDANLVEYLESLVARGFLTIYGSRRGFWMAAVQFAVHDLPRRARGLAPELLASTALFVLGVLVAFHLTVTEPDRFFVFLDEASAQGRTPDASTEDLRSTLYSGAESSQFELHTFAAMLFSHNARIALLAFTLGFLAGLPTALLIFHNGLVLGAMLAVFHLHGLSGEFLAWVLPHGVTEIGGLLFASAAGLSIGRAVVFPGVRTRLENLSAAGRSAAPVVLGAVLAIFLAGLIEGIVRQRIGSVPFRWTMAVLTGGLWTAYLLGLGRAGDAGG